MAVTLDEFFAEMATPLSGDTKRPRPLDGVFFEEASSEPIAEKYGATAGLGDFDLVYSPMSSFQSSGFARMNSVIRATHSLLSATSSSTPRERR